MNQIKKLITIIALTFSIGAWADVINKTCVSDSGLSIYDISLDTEPNSYGEIRYRFMEQDIFYSASIEIREDNKLIGIAQFKENRKTGYPEGVSWKGRVLATPIHIHMGVIVLGAALRHWPPAGCNQ